MMWQTTRAPRLGLIAITLACLFDVIGNASQVQAGDVFLATSLATDATDSQLINPWGISASGTSPFWISNNRAGVATLYSVDPARNAATKLNMVVKIPGDGTVTGQVSNGGTAFNGDRFLFVSEDGTISGWRSALGSNAEILQSPDPTNSYKGVTVETMGGHSYLLSANFRAGNIDVMKGDTGAPDLAGKFVDPNLTAGYAPFNISKLGNTIYVTYALQNGKDDLSGAGHGFVSAFDANGNFLGRIGAMGTLNSPWGLAIAPEGFGRLTGDLLVGNFGDGRINVFSADPGSPAFLGQLTDATTGSPLAIDGLWGVIPGNGTSAGNTHDIYFTAGPDGKSGGMLGVLQSVPEPSSAVLALISLAALSAGWACKNRFTTRREKCMRSPGSWQSCLPHPLWPGLHDPTAFSSAPVTLMPRWRWPLDLHRPARSRSRRPTTSS
jgi:uncharacterized protein (TIGR03118 family)